MGRKSSTQNKGEGALDKAKGKAKEATGATNEQYAAAVTRCESAARNYGHTLSMCYPVAKQLHISTCVLCEAMMGWLGQGMRSVGGLVVRHLSKKSRRRESGTTQLGA